MNGFLDDRFAESSPTCIASQRLGRDSWRLPRRVRLVHCRDDTTVPASSSAEFRSALCFALATPATPANTKKHQERERDEGEWGGEGEGGREGGASGGKGDCVADRHVDLVLLDAGGHGGPLREMMLGEQGGLDQNLVLSLVRQIIRDAL